MTDQDFMRQAIELARRGTGWTNPNPLVGAVIVKDGEIIGEGYHARYGGLHAERSALASLRGSAQGAAMYVTLEPCCHYGRQPPCTQAILESGIKKVFVGSRDPNPLVAGKGVQMLRKNGVQVTEDFLRDECDRLNLVFFHYITTKTPYVVMKYAMTADGKIATRTGASRWITGEPARQKVQELRATYSGIMAGIGTVLADDPLLNVRLEGRRSPVRIVCDSRLRIPLDSQICATARQYKTIVACAACPDRLKEAALENLGVQVLPCPADDGKVNLPALMKELGAMGIDSVLLEGGGTLNESALRAGIVREIRAFVAPKLFGGGSKSPVEGAGVALPDEAWQLELAEVAQIGDDLLLDYRVRRTEDVYRTD
ncbi:MAG: bifunctional diaminohydroxyphosphoribosylaminopyrimidine deaminase/5-amino-6-(5-phosphoribosylamino)uracil reductase RibD [Clostridiales bacterium]|nr:bifunctional diaminohydroxyphosphoribosylaminopyrimidine deaminase/5-amino-6-(5-phosphoribosylamino)uracil reductase RibD [Clostridiales bacterium]